MPHEGTGLYERWYLRGLVALARRNRDEALVSALAPRLADADDGFARRPRGGPFDELCSRLVLDESTQDLFAAIVAFCGDPRLPTHAEVLGGPLARRGVSVATFVELSGMAPVEGRKLVASLTAGHPLLAHGLVMLADPGAAAAARVYQVPPRVLAHLAGDDHCERGVTVIAPDPGWIYDAAQQRTLGELRRALVDQVAILVIDGRAGTGRRSAIAHAFGREIVAIDGERIEPSELEAALTVLGREACLRDTIGVIVDADRISGEAKRRLPGLVESFAGRLAMTSSQGLDLATTRPLIRLRWSPPDVAQRAQLWTSYAGAEIRGVEQLGMR
jgi:hypothetical protein